MTRVSLLLLAATAIAFLVPRNAHAYDVQLDAETVFRAYEVRAPSTATSWTRRRFIQDLELRIAQPLREPRADRPMPRLRAVVQLRLGQEAGDTCFTHSDRCFDASDARVASTYQALATDGLLDAMLAYVDVADAPLGVEARAGRQLWVDSVGFARVDGLSARIAPVDWFAFSAVGGQQVRVTSVAGSSGFEPPGSIRLDLSSREQLLSSFVSDPVNTWLMGAAMELGDERVVRAYASVREVFERDGLVMRRVGMSLRSTPVESLHVSSLAVIDAADPALVLANLNAHWQVDAVGLRLSADAMRPRFDLGSIWAYFPTATVEQSELGADVNVNDATKFGGGLRGRRSLMRDTTDYDAGLHAFVSTRVARVRISGDGYAWLGDLGDLWGADARASRDLGSALHLELGVSAQRINDPAQTRFDGVSISEWARMAWTLTEHTQASVELSHAYNALVAHRLTALASLRIGAWR